MVQLGMLDNFKRQVFQWDGATLSMKEPSRMIWKSYLTSRKMQEVVIQTAEPACTREDNEILVKIIDSTYVKADLKQVADNSTHLNVEKISQLQIFRGLVWWYFKRLGHSARWPGAKTGL